MLSQAQRDSSALTSLEEHSVRGFLRASTAEVHARLEGLTIFTPILTGRARISDVARLLGGYRVFHASASLNLQHGYRELEALGVCAPASSPLALLAGDLKALGGGGMPPAPIEREPACTLSQAVGWVWVVEGSFLGARIIHGALDALFGEGLEGRRFFEPMPESAARWRAVCSVMEIYGRERDCLASMAEGAHQAFACMARSLTYAYDAFSAR